MNEKTTRNIILIRIYRDTLIKITVVTPRLIIWVDSVYGKSLKAAGIRHLQRILEMIHIPTYQKPDHNGLL